PDVQRVWSARPRGSATVEGFESGDQDVALGAHLEGAHLEVALAFAVLHGCLTGPVVGPGLATFGDPGRGDLRDDLVQFHRGGLDRTGTGEITDGPVANHLGEHV